MLKVKKPRWVLGEFEDLLTVVKTASIAGRFSPKNEAKGAVL